MTLGPVMLDLRGLTLSKEEQERLQHRAVGGVILFSRNYDHPEQLRALTHSIRQQRPDMIIAVDHEGGMVQRFRTGLTAIPAMAKWGQMLARDPKLACQGAHACGVVMAWELADLGVDFSFTPVVDLDYGRSKVIGSRAFHAEATAVAQLAQALVEGLHSQGMAAVAKHFPGHGYVTVDSHHALPTDERHWEEISRQDMVPFRRLIKAGIEAVMPAHIVYPHVDNAPAGFSSRWISQCLRQQWNFSGLVISDDLTMGGAVGWGDMEARANASLAAGCDAILVCNDPQAAQQVLTAWVHRPWEENLALRWTLMRHRASTAEVAGRYADYQRARQQLTDGVIR